MRGLLPALLVAALAPLPAAAEEPSVRASVDAVKTGENETVALTIEISGSDLSGVEEPDLSGLRDFTVASGPSISSSTSMVWRGGGAQVTASKKLTYALLPRGTGTLTIPALEITIGGRVHRTRPLQVEVVEGSFRREGNGRRGGGGLFGRDPLGSLRGRSEAGERAPEGEIFIDVQLDRESAYVGQQVLLVYRIFSQPTLAALPQPQEAPSLNGFWVEEIPVDPRATIRKEVIRGKEFTVVTLMKKALFPTRSGELTIEETVFQVPVSVRSRDPFERLLNPSRTVFRRAPARTLRVLPLPDEGRPDSFRGAVGRFSMDVKADRHEASVNDAVGVTVEISGDGNLRTLSEPVVAEAPDYRRFEPKVNERRTVEDDRIQGSREWSYVFVPLAPGRKPLPPIRFSYFDPVVARYKELESPTFEITVARGDAQPGEAAPGGVRREVVAMRQDIRYIKPASDLMSGGTPFHGGPFFYFLLALPVAGNAALYVHLRRREHLEANVHLFRRRRATRLARQRLRKAARLVSAGENAEAFFAEVDGALTGYLADKFNVAASGLTRDRIAALLQDGKVDPSLRRETLECLDRCDMGRFAPGGSGRGRLESLLEMSSKVIAGLERRLS